MPLPVPPQKNGMNVYDYGRNIIMNVCDYGRNIRLDVELVFLTTVHNAVFTASRVFKPTGGFRI